MQSVDSWGRFPKSKSRVLPLFWTSDIPAALRGAPAPILAHGLGRSYGDCCLNDGGTLLTTPHLNRFLAFDPERGRLTCEAGVSLADVLEFSVPRGWFPPVTPGTKFVTLGGAVANDVHGKNHHRAGTFGSHVTRLGLARSDGTVRTCSPTDHADLFRTTIGGLGLTGLITWVEFDLRPIETPWIHAEFLVFRDLEEFLDTTLASDETHEYTVSWIDCSARGKKLGRGIFIRGNHAVEPVTRHAPKSARPRDIPCDAPSWLLNRFSINAFNRLYFHSHALKRGHQMVHCDPFFYPLDAIGHWNRLYGRHGFFQYQCVVPEKSGIVSIIDATQRAGLTSFLSVLKRFADRPSPGLLSFPRPGLTLTMDIPITRGVTQAVDRLDTLVSASGGAIYPAKDAFMSGPNFKRFFPDWKVLEQMRDRAFSSSFWRRVVQE